MTELDKAITDYRDNPTDANRRRLEEAQRRHVTGFYKRNTDDYQRRTR